MLVPQSVSSRDRHTHEATLGQILTSRVEQLCILESLCQRQKDHYSHFILRLAFSSTEDLRRRFTRVETMLFRLRFNSDDLGERSKFIAGLDFDWWETVTEQERQEFAAELAATAGPRKSPEDDSWFKVDWDRVPDLVEGRRVFLRHGKAFVPGRE